MKLADRLFLLDNYRSNKNLDCKNRAAPSADYKLQMGVMLAGCKTPRRPTKAVLDTEANQAGPEAAVRNAT